MPAAVQPGDARGVLEDAAALLGLGVDDLADLPLPHQRRRARARRRILEQDLDVARPRLRPVDAIGRASSRSMRRVTSSSSLSLNSAGACRALLSTKIVTSAQLRPGRLVVPEKITSSMVEARMLL